jgi:ABC-type transport system involved in multi-copper enzyme maturation permease subunit
VRRPGAAGAGLTTERPGGSTEAGGTFTVTGSGDVAGYGIPSYLGGGNDDVVRNALGGVQVGLMAIVALGVLFATSEYKTGTMRVTLVASPRRGRVLAAKAIVVGGTVFAAGLVSTVAAFLLAQPTLRDNGYVPPAYPDLSLGNGVVLRAVIGSALFLAVLAILSLGIGALRRRTVGAVVAVLALILVPQIVAPLLSLNTELWINRLTQVAGLAIQQTRDRFDTAITPWGGFAVLCAWTTVALVVAMWQLRKRDA